MISLMAVFTPIKSTLIAVVVLTLADLIFGVISAVKSKDPITSSNLKKTPVKLLVYLSAMLLGFVVQKYLIQDALPLSNLIATLIGATELKSLLESFDIIYGEPMFSVIIGKLTAMLQKE